MFSACGVSTLRKVELPNRPQTTFRIYLSGAVERDGYYEVGAGTSYMQLFQQAGILSQTILPSFYSNLVDGSVTCFILDYYDGAICQSINVNSALIVGRLPVSGLSSEVVNKLADYIEYNGAISNRQQLKEALGSDYQDNYYKLYIAEADYEEVG